MNKYAIFVNFCAVHLPGFNALVNGLDLWENHIDVVAIYESTGVSRVPEAYIEALRSQPFSFHVELIPFESILSAYPDEETDKFVNSIFAPYKVMLEFQNTYDAVSYWGGDQSILGNLDNWYKIGAETDLILCADNPYQLGEIADWKPEIHQAPDYLWDMPFICNPRTHKKTIERIYEEKFRSRNNLHGTNYAIIDLGLTKNILYLPDNVWTVGLPYLFRLSKYYDNNGRPRLFGAGNRILSFHKKWWHQAACDSYTWDKKGGLHVACEENVHLMRDLYDEMNRIGKLKLNYERYRDGAGNWQIRMLS